MKIQKVGVVGCGLMGHGIAQVAAQGGHDVVVVESDPKALETGLARIDKSLAKIAEKAVEKGTPKEQAEAARAAARARLRGALGLETLADRDLVVEAIVEDLDAKKRLFATLHPLCRTETIFASNTSSFPIAEMARAGGRPRRTLGLHFFNPVQLMKLVEVVRTADTDPDVAAAGFEFAKACGKTPIAAKDTPGFVVNRLLVPFLAEALRMVERGDASAEDVDTAMMLGCGHPMGPITLADYVGLDTTLSILEGWRSRHPQEPVFAVPESLRAKVRAGLTGRKVGQGFYRWQGDKRV
ncbi:MAG: 3-hydroxybutyryl-CoA dehydrogenase [Planctomycetes bacterium]|nr:3-hydroxybutyryl-CoA dehydrogenase [Planctomycetota bacterium]